MRILSIRRAIDDGGRRFRLRAFYDVQLTDEIRLFGLQLMQAPDGRLLTFAPAKHGMKVVTFAPNLAEQLTNLAAIELEGSNAHDRTAA